MRMYALVAMGSSSIDNVKCSMNGVPFVWMMMSDFYHVYATRRNLPISFDQTDRLDPIRKILLIRNKSEQGINEVNI